MKRTIADMLIKLANRISPPEPAVRHGQFNIDVACVTAEFGAHLEQHLAELATSAKALARSGRGA